MNGLMRAEINLLEFLQNKIRHLKNTDFTDKRLNVSGSINDWKFKKELLNLANFSNFVGKS